MAIAEGRLTRSGEIALGLRESFDGSRVAVDEIHNAALAIRYAIFVVSGDRESTIFDLSGRGGMETGSSISSARENT